MLITRNCIFLSDSNIELMSSIRDYSRKIGIEISPCRQIMEMLYLYNKGANAILIEKVDKFGNLKDYISEQNNKDFFYLQNHQVFDLNNKLVYKSLENFFKSKIFKQKIIRYTNANDKISKKLNELGIVFNTWNSRCIKLILQQMVKENKPVATLHMMQMIAISCGSKVKVLYDKLRPTLKQYTIRLNNQTNQKNDTRKVRQMLNVLYDYCLS